MSFLCRSDLKIQNTSQLKYVTDDDYYQLGMSKPEVRRLKKYFNKYYPQNYLSKFKKMLLPKKDDQVIDLFYFLFRFYGYFNVTMFALYGKYCSKAMKDIKPQLYPFLIYVIYQCNSNSDKINAS